MKAVKQSTTVVLLAVALAGFGCGGNESETTVPLTKRQFVKEGNAICEAGLKRVGNAYPDATAIEKMDKAEMEDMIRSLVPPFQRMINELRDLAPPQSDQPKIAKILRSFEEALDILDSEPDRGLAGEYVFTKATDPASSYGLIECVP